MKILIFVPANPTNPQVYQPTIDSVLSLEWSSPLTVQFELERGPAVDTRDKYQNLTDKLNRARKMAIDGLYDKLMIVEYDMIIPRNTLLRLSSIDAGAVYGLYNSRHHNHRLLAFDSIGDRPEKNISYSDLSVDDRKAVWGSAVETMGMGLGCTMIDRDVFRAIPFRCPKPEFGGPDWWLAFDLAQARFSQITDFGVPCGHIHQDGFVLYPEVLTGFDRVPMEVY